MIIFISKRNLKELENIMSQFLDDFRAALAKVSVGNASDPAMKQDIADLKTRLTTDEATDDDYGIAINELVNKLAASTPVAVPPTVTALSPTTGSITGGETVTLTGTGLTGLTAVLFGTVSASSIVVVSDTDATVSAPAGVAGVVDVTVTTAAGTSPTSGATKYTYA